VGTATAADRAAPAERHRFVCGCRLSVMTRFDADTPAERRKLFAEAVTAHRTRGSPFLTVEVASDPALDGTDDDGDALPGPWIQFAEKTFNLDVTDDEHERLEALLDDFREFRIDEVSSPEESEGTNVRITARSDANRLAAFVDRAFQDVYGRDEDYRAWVTRV
jgi:hypothetical protein